MDKVKESDLIDGIKDFPMEVVQAMCVYQVIQGNEFNVDVFKKFPHRNKSNKGFDWNETADIINKKQSILF